MSNKCPKCKSENPESATFCADCGTQLPPTEQIEVTATIEAPRKELTTGSTFAGRYQVIEELGKGGMGKVYKVLDKETNEKIALKLIKPEIASDKKTVERFRNELTTARKIVQKNVCRMYDLNKEKENYYITMEYISGQDLKGLIRQTGQLTVGKAVSIAKQICDGLAEAHSLGTVHRDLKPNNIMIDKEGNAKIMDFGIARSLRAKGITGPGVMIGTPEYMSPEQVEAKEIDQRSDIYSLGIILYEMTTGHLPFEADTPFAIGVKQKSEVPKEPASQNSRIPEDLNRLILKCLEKEKENRYQNAEGLLADLIRIEQGIPTTERVESKKSSITSKEITVKFTLRKLLYPAVGIAALTILVLAFLLFFPRAEPNRHSVAVISFENNTGNEAYDYLKSAIPNLLITGLEQSRELRVISWERMHDVLLSMGETDIQTIDKDLGFKLCQQEGVEAIITGSFIKTGEMFATDVKVLEVANKELIKSASAKGLGAQSIIENQIDDLAREISKGLGLRRKTSSDQTQIAEVTTSSMEAYNYYIMGKEADMKRYWEDARKYLERAVVLDPEFAMAHYYLTRAYYGLGNTKAYREAGEAAYKYSKKASRRERLEIERNYALNVEGDEEKNIDILKQIQKEFPQDKEVHYFLGFAYVDKGMVDDGIREYKTYIDVHPNPNPRVYNNLGSIYLDKRNFDTALEYKKKYAALSPDNASAVTSLAVTYFWMGNLEETISQLEKALRINPEYYAAYFRIAYAHTLKEEYEEAFAYLEKASMMAPSSAGKAISLVWRSILYYWQGRMEESLALSRQVPGMVQEVENKWIEGFGIYHEGWVNLFRKEFEKCRQYMDKAFEHMAKYFPSRQTFDKAQEEYCQAIVDIEEGKMENLANRLEQIRSLYEEEMPSWTKYTYLTISGILALTERRFDDALVNINKAKEIEGSFLSMSWNWLFSMNFNPLKDLRARTYLAMGDLDRAIQAYEQITTFDPESADRLMIHPLWHYELAKLYEINGEGEKAEERYEKFLDLWKDADPGIAEVDDARTRLAGLQKLP